MVVWGTFGRCVLCVRCVCCVCSYALNASYASNASSFFIFFCLLLLSSFVFFCLLLSSFCLLWAPFTLYRSMGTRSNPRMHFFLALLCISLLTTTTTPTQTTLVRRHALHIAASKQTGSRSSPKSPPRSTGDAPTNVDWNHVDGTSLNGLLPMVNTLTLPHGVMVAKIDRWTKNLSGALVDVKDADWGVEEREPVL